jgi:hypothetical protein
MKQGFLTPLLIASALSSSAQQHTPQASTPNEKVNGTQSAYQNAAFGFRYQTPYGWVDRTKTMQEGSESGKSDVLLAVFERPPEVSGDGVNAAVVIATEGASSYPGLKTAADYLGPMTEVAAAKGFKSASDASEIAIDGRTLVRADFTKTLNDKLTMHQTTLVMLAKGRVLSFTVLAGSADEIEDLLAGLRFTGASSNQRSPARH